MRLSEALCAAFLLSGGNMWVSSSRGHSTWNYIHGLCVWHHIHGALCVALSFSVGTICDIVRGHCVQHHYIEGPQCVALLCSETACSGNIIKGHSVWQYYFQVYSVWHCKEFVQVYRMGMCQNCEEQKKNLILLR